MIVDDDGTMSKMDKSYILVVEAKHSSRLVPLLTRKLLVPGCLGFGALPHRSLQALGDAACLSSTEHSMSPVRLAGSLRCYYLLIGRMPLM